MLGGGHFACGDEMITLSQVGWGFDTKFYTESLYHSVFEGDESGRA